MLMKKFIMKDGNDKDYVERLTIPIPEAHR